MILNGQAKNGYYAYDKFGEIVFVAQIHDFGNDSSKRIAEII